MSTAKTPPHPSNPARPSHHADRKAAGERPGFNDLIKHWGLDRDVVFLNHGSFGATPLRILEAQREVQDRIEREPLRFYVEDLEPLTDEARAGIAPFVGCDMDDLCFVLNATMAVSTVVRSIDWQPGDELLTSNQEYNACSNALTYVAERTGARVVRATLPFPVSGDDEMVEALMSHVTPRTRLVLLSHITSPTGLIIPVKKIVDRLKERGIDTLVDGAHTPGFLPLNVREIDAAYYCGNFHKWVCAPKGSAFLYVRPDLQKNIRPLIISHGLNSTRTDRSRFRLEMDYIGAIDPSAWFVTPLAIEFIASLVSGGWPEVMRRNRQFALDGRDLLCRRLGTTPPVPDSMLGPMAAVRIAPKSTAEAKREADATPAGALPTRYWDPLADRLVRGWGIQVPIIPFPCLPDRLVRISGQLYNTMEQVDYLCDALLAEIGPTNG